MWCCSFYTRSWTQWRCTTRLWWTWTRSLQRASRRWLSFCSSRRSHESPSETCCCSTANTRYRDVPARIRSCWCETTMSSFMLIGSSCYSWLLVIYFVPHLHLHLWTLLRFKVRLVCWWPPGWLKQVLVDPVPEEFTYPYFRVKFILFH